jgi:transcription elongation factor Elf1
MFKYSSIAVENNDHLLYPVYGLYFKPQSKSNEEILVFTSPRSDEEFAVYAAQHNNNRVYIKGELSDPEVMMSELYYRNSAGHAYADYDINKVKFNVDNTHVVTEGLDPDKLYHVEDIMKYVARNWYNNADGILPGEASLDKEDTKRGEALLKRSGGPFDYDTIVYLWNFRTRNGKTEQYYYACSGGLGHLIDHPEYHVPFTDHYMYGSYIEETVGTRKYVEELPIKYNCGCSKEKFMSGIATLEEEEILDMIEKDKGAELECQICGKKYKLTEEDLKECIEIKKNK